MVLQKEFVNVTFLLANIFSPKRKKLMENLAELVYSYSIVHYALQQNSKFDLIVIITRMAYHLHLAYK